MASRPVNSAKRTPRSGRVSIAEEVIGAIASIAAKEVPGVSDLKGSVTDGLAAILGEERHGKGVAAQLTGDQSIRVRLKLVVEYDYPLVEVARKVQAKVKEEIEGMTGLRVSAVDVYIQELDLGDERGAKRKVQKEEREP
ncbi:MAG: Asp23/Gls24 family envelope stress response protein [Candidatus Bipolaricaulota bacterium]|nr:Asp23/Gls24 family envelope stress response protein [Candidatus Bipolaricaulota bacterium]MCS7274742.1 Asp23/Gls24 family envelope stress response protein [Candidatus Bipolaricaulota bacterium]MDW8110021.1 Asp23/Gls24 family envelope stress response protein [Candidatus Bipolaricaulota bacterium]MDW8328907.1 Asp23/Gls24 family envelope stress response protein [Candidatus Bipolaricaulota bacterium]